MRAITLHDLRIAARQIAVQVGVDGEKGDATADGRPFPVLSIPDLIGKNLILSALVGGLIAALLKWVQKVWFPGKPGEPKPE
jgi:hypothetical protein